MSLVVKYHGLRDYCAAWGAMRSFTDARTPETADEIWFMQHPPVYTLGLAGRYEHIVAPGTIPVVRTDRGGQVTYHGPGQLLAYVLFDLQRAGIGIRALVWQLEQAVIALLAGYGVEGWRRPGAPGIYVGGAKIAALGLRVRRGRSYHGIAINVAMDLTPFAGINPCGYPGLAVTQLRDLGVTDDPASVADAFSGHVRSLWAGTAEPCLKPCAVAEIETAQVGVA